jgi:hypothetical protein
MCFRCYKFLSEEIMMFRKFFVLCHSVDMRPDKKVFAHKANEEHYQTSFRWLVGNNVWGMRMKPLVRQNNSKTGTQTVQFILLFPILPNYDYKLLVLIPRGCEGEGKSRLPPPNHYHHHGNDCTNVVPTWRLSWHDVIVSCVLCLRVRICQGMSVSAD